MLRLVTLALAGCCAATSTLPQEGPQLPFDPAVTEACLADSQGSARLDCVGASAEVCSDSPDGYTTVGMGLCFGKELAYWDARLQAAISELRDIETENDAFLDEVNSAAPRSLTALETMLAAWVQFRTAACGYELSTWGGGSGGGPATTACVMHETADMAMLLEDRVARRGAQ